MQDSRLAIGEIAARPGAGRQASIRLSLEGVATPLVTLREDVPVVAEVRADGVVEGVLVTGTVRGEMEAKCARCLTPVRSRVEVDVGELFTSPERVADLPAEDRDEVYLIDGDEIDLEPMIRDALTLALPLNPVCSEDCKGLCARCGRDLNEGECDCRDEDTDPRWAALDEVRARLEAG